MTPGDLAPFAKLPRGLSPLGYRDFALYWMGAATTTTGRWIELTGLVWVVYEMTQSPLLVGLLGAARAVPAFVISPIAGVMADRLNQRTVLVITQSLSLVCSFILAVLIMTGHAELWHIYLQVLIQASITAVDAAIRQALFPRLVPRFELPRAVTLSITATRVSKLIGPATGGLMIAALGNSAPFFANAISYLGLMVAVLALRPTPPLTGKEAATFLSDLLEGLRHILSVPVMSGLIRLEIVFGLFELNPAIIAIIGREILDVGPSELGFLLAAPALGSFVGIGWLLSGDRTRRQGRFGLICTMAYGLLVALLSLSAGYVFAFAVLAVIGALEVLVTVTRNSIMQLAAPEHMRGRVMANMGVVTRGLGPMAETQSGVLASLVGPSMAVLIAGGVICAAAGATAVTNRALWRFSFDNPSRPG